MSGLALFFRDYLPANEETDDGLPSYGSAISPAAVIMEGSTAANHQPGTSDDEETHDDEHNEQMNAGMLRMNSQEIYVDPLHQKQKEILLEFLDKRLNTASIEEEEAFEEKQEEDKANRDTETSQDSAAIDESQMFLETQQMDALETQQMEALETQMPEVATSPEAAVRLEEQQKQSKMNETTTEGTARKRHYHKRVPHEDETLHAAEYLADMNLYTKQLKLRLTRVDKFWGLRDIGRHFKTEKDGIVVAPSPCEVVCYTSCHEYFQRLVLSQHREDDGPLASCGYRKVLSCQAQQLDKGEVIRQRAMAMLYDANSADRVATRLKVFFYDAYAEAVDKILQECCGNHHQQGDLFLQFENIPARCIMPFAPSDWFDRGQDLAEYCVCIGGKSKLAFKSPDGSKSRIVFDDPAMRIYFGRAKSNNEKCLTEWKLVAQDKSVCVEKCEEDQGSIIPHYQTWLDSLSRASASGGNKEDTDAQPRAEGTTARKENSGHSGTTGENAQGKKAQDESSWSILSHKPTVNNQLSSPSPRKKKARQTIVYTHLHYLRNFYETSLALERESGRRTPDAYLVNLYCLVVGFGAPARTKRGDWKMSVTLVDQSLPHSDEGGDVQVFIINIFTQFRDDLPEVRHAGDVLRLHRVKVQQWQGDIQLAGLRGSSYLVARGNTSDSGGKNWEILPTAKKNFTMTMIDKGRIERMWHWGQKRLLFHPSMKTSQGFTLSDMQMQESDPVIAPSSDAVSGDLTAMVAGIIPAPPDRLSRITPRGFLRVWDGTGQPMSDPWPVPLNGPLTNDPPPGALLKLSKIVTKLQHIPNYQELQPAKALTGRVVNVAIWENSLWQLARTAVTVGSFVRLRNVREGRLQDSNSLCIMVSDRSQLTPLPDMTFEVAVLLKEHNKRILRKDPFNPSSGILELTDDALASIAMDAAADSNYLENNSDLENAFQPYDMDAPDLHAATIGGPNQIAAQQEDNIVGLCALRDKSVPTLFSGFVRVVSIYPPMETNLPEDIEQVVVLGDDGGPVYQFALKIQDENSEEVDVVVGEGCLIGETIFGMPASNALQDKQTALHNLRTVLNGRKLWKANVTSISYEGEKYFVLETLTET